MKIGFKNLGKPMITVEVPAEAQDLTLREIVEIVLLSVYGDMPCPHPIMVDPAARIDLRAGPAPLREKWILSATTLAARRSGRPSTAARANTDPKLASLRFEHLRRPRRAKAGQRDGDALRAPGQVTPEMEYIAIRETLRLNELRQTCAMRGC